MAAIAWLDPDTRVPSFEATLVGGAALVAIGLLSRVRGGALLALAGIVARLRLAVHPVQEWIRKGQGYRNGYRTFPMQVDRVGDVDRFAFAIDQQSRGEATVIQFWLPGATMVPWGAGEPPPEPWAIAPIDSQRAIDAGGRQVFRDVRVHSALWVMPGPEQDRMAEEGRLLAEDPSAPLPASARRGSITSATRVSLRAGEPARRRLDVRVRDLGDQPWLDFDSYRGTGAVRVAARWLALPGGVAGRVPLVHHAKSGAICRSPCGPARRRTSPSRSTPWTRPACRSPPAATSSSSSWCRRASACSRRRRRAHDPRRGPLTANGPTVRRSLIGRPDDRSARQRGGGGWPGGVGERS